MGNRDTPAFVFIAIEGSGADGECRELVEEKVEPVIVVKDHDHVGLLACEPIVHVIEALEKWTPIRVLVFAFGDRFADRGHMCGGDATDDHGHAYLPAATSFALKSATVMSVCCAPISCTLRPEMPASLAR